MARTLWLKRVRPNVAPGRTHALPRMLIESVWTDGKKPPVGKGVLDVFEVLEADNAVALFDADGNPRACAFCDFVSDSGELTDGAGAVIDLTQRTVAFESGFIDFGKPPTDGEMVLRHAGQKLVPFRGAR